MQKQLIAAQTFLGGIRSLSTYELARDRQCSQVLKSLKKVACLTAGQAATFLQALGEDLWASSQVEVMKEAGRPPHGLRPRPRPRQRDISTS